MSEQEQQAEGGKQRSRPASRRFTRAWKCIWCGRLHRNPKAPPRRRPKRTAKRVAARGGYLNFPPCRHHDHPGRAPAKHVQPGWRRFFREHFAKAGRAQ